MASRPWSFPAVVGFAAVAAVGLSRCGEAAEHPCAGVFCSSRGFCVEDQGNAYCACLGGFHPDGLACEANDPVAPCTGVDCGGHGVCRATASGPECDCQEGFRPLWEDDPRCADLECALHCVPDLRGDAGADADDGRDADDGAEGDDGAADRGDEGADDVETADEAEAEDAEPPDTEPPPPPGPSDCSFTSDPQDFTHCDSTTLETTTQSDSGACWNWCLSAAEAARYEGDYCCHYQEPGHHGGGDSLCRLYPSHATKVWPYVTARFMVCVR